MYKINLGIIKIAFYGNGGIAMTVKTGLKSTDFNVYILRNGFKNKGEKK